MSNLRCEWSLTYLLFPRVGLRCEFVINISFVFKGGRGLRCELVITMC
ncbi:unnamed protein product, partial [Staurois parvus]